MKREFKNIKENDLDWVSDVNEYDEFFKFFRKGPGQYIHRDYEYWTQEFEYVNYVLDHLQSDIGEMLDYAGNIKHGDKSAQHVLDNLESLEEPIKLVHGQSELSNHIITLRGFIKTFIGFFGEKTNVSEMLTMCISAMEYAEKNNINIHKISDDLVRLERGGQPIVENFDWAINDISPLLEVGEPMTISNPKNSYRVHFTHGHGEENGIWSDNWVTYTVNNIDGLIRIIKILNTTINGHQLDIGELVNLWIKGEKWIFSKSTNNHIEDYINNSGWTLEENYNQIEEFVEENLREDLMDYGLLEHNSYYDDYATLERWHVRFFDEFGVEHKVKVNIPQS